jgi:serine/threonine protein phosphatase PrpC
MSNDIWKYWGMSATGPLHIKMKLENQDCWMARDYKWGQVVVVSDGLGSKLHSAYGSRTACRAVLEASKIFANHSEARIDNLPALIHAIWILKTAPYKYSDCAATCLFVIHYGGNLIIGRLGDGMIAALSENGRESILLSDDKQDSFTNYTYCLHADFHAEKWEMQILDASLYKGVLLCTDGISEDLLSDRKIEFAQDVYSNYTDCSSIERNTDIRRWLHEWPVKGHTDDKTIACLYKKRSIK